MALQTPPRSSTPAPVLLTGLALVGLTLGLLAVRVHTRLQTSAPRSFPAEEDFQPGELADLRALSVEGPAPAMPSSPLPNAQWSSSGHALAGALEDREETPPELTWGPVLAQEQSIQQAQPESTPSSEWSSRSHAPTAPRTAPAPPPEMPAITGLPVLSGREPLTAAARTQGPGSHSPDGAPDGHSLALPAAPRDLPVVAPPETATVHRPDTPAAARPVLEDPGAPGSTVPADALAHSLTRGDMTRPQVLLSFDGGSEASAASAILNTLEREGVRTTLFLTGDFIRNHAQLVHRILAEGHEIGNHTQHHRHFTTWESNRRHDTRPDVNRQVLLGELEGARQALLQVAGVDMAPFWRAPYGEVNPDILRWAADAGYLHVGWSPGLDSLDWVADPSSRNYRSPQDFLSVLARKARGEPHGLNGAIILMHLHSNRPGGERFDRHLGETIRWLRAAGYDLVPASSLAGLTGTPGSVHRPTTARSAEGG